jgi:hypothetical protein
MVKKLILQKTIFFGVIILNSDSYYCFCCYLDLTTWSHALHCNCIAMHCMYGRVNH